METSPIAGKSWHPSHEPPHKKGQKVPVPLNEQWKEEGRGGENCLGNKLPLLTKLQVHAQTTHKNTSNEEHMEFQRLLIY